MPVNLGKAQKAIEDYRVAHTLLHQQNPPNGNPSWQISNMHDPLTNAMRTECQKWGFNHEDDVFAQTDLECVQGMGYVDVAEFMATVYDADGNVNSGYEDDHATWEARWK